MGHYGCNEWLGASMIVEKCSLSSLLSGFVEGFDFTNVLGTLLSLLLVFLLMWSITLQVTGYVGSSSILVSYTLVLSRAFLGAGFITSVTSIFLPIDGGSAWCAFYLFTSGDTSVSLQLPFTTTSGFITVEYPTFRLLFYLCGVYGLLGFLFCFVGPALAWLGGRDWWAIGGGFWSYLGGNGCNGVVAQVL